MQKAIFQFLKIFIYLSGRIWFNASLYLIAAHKCDLAVSVRAVIQLLDVHPGIGYKNIQWLETHPVVGCSNLKTSSTLLDLFSQGISFYNGFTIENQ